MTRIYATLALAAIFGIATDVRAQPPVGGATIRPEGPGRFVVVNALGQRTGTLVETSPGVFQMRDDSGRLSEAKWRKRADGGWDFVPSPFGEKQSR